MGNRVVVKPHTEGTDLVSIKRVRKNARPHFMGGCILKNITILPDGIEGDLLDEFVEARELGVDALKHMTELVYEPGSGFGTVTVHDEDDEDSDEIVMFHPATGNTYRAAYVCGADFYVA